MNSMTNNQVTYVANGKHVVPKGVAVQNLDGGLKKFAKECPVKLSLLLKYKGARLVYDQFVAAVTETRKTRNVFGNWKDAELNSVLDRFRDTFAQFGIKVALCKRSSGSGMFLWLEFIDTIVQPGYVSQYDVANMSGQTIKTLHTTLEFPCGVVVKELLNRRDLCEIDLNMEQMLTKKHLMMEHNRLIRRCIDDGVGGWILKNWNNEKLVKVVAELKPMFHAKGVDIFVCCKLETVHAGKTSYTRRFLWLEFVDREQQPNYYAQRDAATHHYDMFRRRSSCY